MIKGNFFKSKTCCEINLLRCDLKLLLMLNLQLYFLFFEGHLSLSLNNLEQIVVLANPLLFARKL